MAHHSLTVCHERSHMLRSVNITRRCHGKSIDESKTKQGNESVSEPLETSTPCDTDKSPFPVSRVSRLTFPPCAENAQHCLLSHGHRQTAWVTLRSSAFRYDLSTTSAIFMSSGRHRCSNPTWFMTVQLFRSRIPMEQPDICVSNLGMHAKETFCCFHHARPSRGS